MAFILGAFASGLAEGAAESIEKRNKEIRQSALREFEALRKEAEEQNEKVKTQRDKLRSTAQVLSSYRGANNAGFTQAQIIGLLQNPEVAKRVSETLQKNEDNLDQIDFSKLYTVTKGKTDVTVDDFIQQSTAFQQPPTKMEAQPAVRGAFGLPTKAYQRAQAEFEKTAGMPVSKMRAMAQGPAEPAERIEGVLDFSQFKKPETLANITGRLRDNIANGENINSPANKKLISQLQANAVIEARFGDKEGDKPRTTAQINSVLDKTLRAGLDPFIIGGVVRFDPTLNDYIPIKGDAESINSFMKQKNELIQNQSRALGILDKDNNIIGGRNSVDALLPYAEIKDNKVVSWKTATVPAVAAPAPATPAAPAKGATSEVLAIPKTADGKVDGSKLVAGKQYRAADGTVKTWNGISWQ